MPPKKKWKSLLTPFIEVSDDNQLIPEKESLKLLNLRAMVWSLSNYGLSGLNLKKII